MGAAWRPADGPGARAHAALCCAAWRGQRMQQNWRCCCRNAGWADAVRTWRRGWIGGTRDRSARAEASRKLAGEVGRKRAERVWLDPKVAELSKPPPLGILLAEAYPDNIARRRDAFWRGLADRRGQGPAARSGLTSGPRRMARGRRCAGRGQGRADHRGDCARRGRGQPLAGAPDRAAHHPALDRRRRPGRGAARSAAGCDHARAAGPIPRPIPRQSAASCLSRVRRRGAGPGAAVGKASLALLIRARFAGIAALAEASVARRSLEQTGSARCWAGGSISSIRASCTRRCARGWTMPRSKRSTSSPRRSSPAQPGPATRSTTTIPAGRRSSSGSRRCSGSTGIPVRPAAAAAAAQADLDPAANRSRPPRDLPGFWRGSWRMWSTRHEGPLPQAPLAGRAVDRSAEPQDQERVQLRT